MAEMKGIKLCGECINYDWKKHKCKIGCNDDSNAQAPFYGDCPLPDVVPKSEVARLQEDVDRLQEINNRQVENIKLAKQEVAREIFAEIEDVLNNIGYFDEIDCNALKKKYTEGE